MHRTCGALLISLCIGLAGCQSTVSHGSERGAIGSSETDTLRINLEESKKRQDKARTYLTVLRDMVELAAKGRGLNTDQALRLLERLQATGDPKVKDLFEKFAGTTNPRVQEKLGVEFFLTVIDGALDALKQG